MSCAARIRRALPVFARFGVPVLVGITVLVTAANPSPVRGAMRTWDGGGADNNWNTPANWSSDLVPGAMDRAVFDGTSTKDATINLNVSVQGMQIDVGYTGTITQAAGSTLTVGVADFSQAAGTFVGGTAAITVNNAFTLSGGSFTSTTATLTITGAVTKTGGVFAHNGGTVAFSTSNVTINVGGTETFNNVSFLSGTKTIAAGNTLVVTGTLNLAGGGLSTGTLAAQGNIDAQIGFTGGGTATLLINGAGAQTFTGFHTTATGSLPNVDIAKPSGTLTIAGTLRTARNWTYTAGTLSVAGSTLIFNGTQTITGSHALNNVEIRGGTITIAAGTTLTATGSLNLFSGGLSTGTLAAQGDINAQIGFTGGGSATLLINGAGAQTFTGFHTTATGSLPNVDIAKPSGTLTIAGTLRTARNWTYTAGTLDPGTSTLVFTGTPTITGSHTLNAVEIRGGTITIAAGTTLTATGSLTLFSGSLNQVGATGTLAAQGDINARIGFTGGGSATLLINGAGAQTFDGDHTSATGALPNIVIDKPSGTLFLVGTIRMLTSSWTWLQGAVDSGTSAVYFDTTVTISGTHSLSNVYLSGGPHTVTGGDTLTALGTLTLDNGTIDGGTVAAAGPLTQLSTFDGGSGLLRVVGTGNQTFDGFATIGAGDLPAFEIDKASGILTLTGTIRTTNSWAHLSGTVDPDASLVVFAGTSSLAAAGMTFNDLTVNGGTTTLVQDLNVGGDLWVAVGTMDGAGMTIAVGGDVTIDGAFTPGTGLLVMNGVVPQILGGAAASIGLYDLTVNNAAGVTITTAVSVAGTLTLNGPLDISGQTLGIANAIAGTPTNLTGDPLSSLVVSGTGAGIVIPSSLPVLANLTLDNPNGAALAGPITIGSLLTLTNGVLGAGAWVVTIDPAASVARTAGHVNGALEKTIPIGANMTATFEIGDATTYAPVSLLFGAVSGSGTVTAFTVPGEHPNIGSSVIDPAQDVNRWWSLANGGTVFDSIQATFTWQPADVDPGAQTSAFVVGKWDGAWVLPASGAALPTSITAFGMTSLSEFAAGEVESGDLPDTAQDMAVPAPAVFLASLLAGLMVLAALAALSTRAGQRTAPVAASPRADWETFWQDHFR